MVDASRDVSNRLPFTPDALANGNANTIRTGATANAGSIDTNTAPDTTDVDPAGGQNRGTGSPTPPGAPLLDAPSVSLSPTEMALAVSILLSKIDDAQSKSESQGLNLSDQQRREAPQRSNDKIQESAKKLEAAQHKKKTLGILATIGKVFAGIAAVALTVVTGGAAAPLAVAIIAYTVVDTTLTIPDAISGAAGGPRLDLQSLMKEGITAVAKKFGASDKKAAEIGEWGSFGIQMAFTALTLAYNVTNIVGIVRGAANAGKSIVTMSNAAFKITKAAGIAGTAISGVTTATSGALTVSVAMDQKDADHAQADKVGMDAEAAMLTEAIKNILDRLQQLAADRSSNMDSATQNLKSAAQTNLAVASGGSAMV
jgi:hypothetical protein